MTDQAPRPGLTDIDAAPPALAPALAALAEAAGIEPAYHDIWGTAHRADAAALTALLGAMGLPAADEATAAATLAALEAEAAATLPPVVVLRRGRPWTLPLGPGVASAATWTLTLEDGSTRSGVLHSDLPLDLPDGYHHLALNAADRTPVAETALIIAPAACWLPEPMAGGQRLWGLACQLYTLRDDDGEARGNWGLGDLADLADLGRRAGQAGADLIGINPLHALFPGRPADASPYSPCSRLFLNPLYIAVEAVPEWPRCTAAHALAADPAFRDRLAAARAADWVDYPAVAALKEPVLRALHATFRAEATPARAREHAAFVAAGGERLRLFALFLVLQKQFAGQGWRQWPADYHDPRGAAVTAFAARPEVADEMAYHLWAQFEADRQLATAAAALRAAGGRVGLYRDLAVGVNSDGADAWVDQDVYAVDARFGAPPDDLGPLGQDWGLPPFNPRTLRARAYAPFAAMLRANMRHAGALRIDHAMALQHLFWIPPGLTAAEGAYVTYPMDDLLGVLALESHRARCLVIGEDLGTVPEGFRERMTAENVLSYRILYFERWASGLFKRPDAYPPLAAAVAASHDMAPVLGHWQGWDVATRRRLGLVRTGEDTAAGGPVLPTPEEERAADRLRLIAALQDQSLLATDFPARPDLDDAERAELLLACHRFLARTPALVMMAALDDLAGAVSAVNVPGTVDEYPNWRRRLDRPTATILETPLARAVLDAIALERG